MKLSDADVRELRRLEESLLTSEVRRSPEMLASTIADDFCEVGVSGGLWDKQDVLEAADRLPDVEVPLTEFNARALSPTAALVTYRSVTRLPDGELHARRSSIWVREADGWVITFHQGTRTDDRA